MRGAVYTLEDAVSLGTAPVLSQAQQGIKQIHIFPRRRWHLDPGRNRCGWSDWANQEG